MDVKDTKSNIDKKQVAGIVKVGEKIARTLGFPTANLDEDLAKKHNLEEGIFVCHVHIAGRGEQYKGVAVFGVPPAFKEGPGKVEVHILDFDEDIYGETLSVQIEQKIRDLRSFTDNGDLINQMKEDVRNARALLGS